MTDTDPPHLPNSPDFWSEFLPILSRETHKYARGHCIVLSGPELQTGASRLAATAALNCGAGVVSLVGDKNALRIHATHVTAIMLLEASSIDTFEEILDKKPGATFVIGPAAGIGLKTLEMVLAVRRRALSLVVDADALSSLIDHLDAFRGPTQAESKCVMTPHAGEFARLFGPLLAKEAGFLALSAELRESKIEQTRAAARLAHAVIVFKGADTIIAAPDGRAAINTNAGPELATAGSGDVLSGLIGAHLAGNMPAFEAAAAAVWLHGFLGKRIGFGLTADRLVAEVKPLSAFI